MGDVVKFPILWHKNCRCQIKELPDLKPQEEIDAEEIDAEVPPVTEVRILLTGIAIAAAVMGWWIAAAWFFFCVIMARKSVEHWGK